jgi:hypothetical protein
MTDPPNDGLNYSQVDMRLNNGLGDVVSTEKRTPVTYNKSDDVEAKFKSEKNYRSPAWRRNFFWDHPFYRYLYSFKISTRGVNKSLSRHQPLLIFLLAAILNALT